MYKASETLHMRNSLIIVQNALINVNLFNFTIICKIFKLFFTLPHQVRTIHDILVKPAQTGPYTTPLRVKVFATDGKKNLSDLS